MGESIAEGTIVRWIKKVGDLVDRDEPLFEISTDKVDAEIPSPAAGVLTDIAVKEGETVAVNSVVATIGVAGEVVTGNGAASAPVAKAAAPAAPAAPDAPDAPAEDRQKSSPLVRKIAKEHGVDIGQIAGSGIGGRVTKQDILGFIETGPGVAARGGEPLPTAKAPAQVWAPGTVEVQPMSVIRKKIAEHMVLSKRTSAHVYSVFEVNYTRVDQIRKAKKDDYESRGAKLTYTAFIAQVVDRKSVV